MEELREFRSSQHDLLVRADGRTHFRIPMQLGMCWLGIPRRAYHRNFTIQSVQREQEQVDGADGQAVS